ncbi:hypothetical protein N7499_003234 [Penicillium canescens]|nr:hypothetical protein N7499_003234 [Penicillium canescens]KAJ6174743.1 hypothetical protein N7485_005187 [Penicillium canescens]
MKNPSHVPLDSDMLEKGSSSPRRKPESWFSPADATVVPSKSDDYDRVAADPDPYSYKGYRLRLGGLPY